MATVSREPREGDPGQGQRTILKGVGRGTSIEVRNLGGKERLGAGGGERDKCRESFVEETQAWGGFPSPYGIWI